MTRHDQTDLVVALFLRRPAKPCGPRTRMESIVPEIAGKIDTAVRQIRPYIGMIGHLCRPINVTDAPRPNAPKHKSP